MTSKSKGDQIQPTLFVQLLNRFFDLWAPFLVKHDVKILVLLLIFSLVTSIKIPFTKQQDDIRTGWCPEGARAVTEMKQYTRYLGKHPADPIAAIVFIEAQDGGSMLRVAHLKESLSLLDELSQAVSFRNRTFDDLCGSMCAINDPLRLLYNTVLMSPAANETGATLKEGIAFPTMTILGKEIDLSPHLFGVQLNEEKALIFAKVAAFTLQTGKPQDWTREDVMEYERRLYTHTHKNFRTSLINPRCLSLTFATDEIVRTGEAIFPYIGVGFMIMATFAVLSVWWGCRKFQQWSFTRAQLAILACVCPLLATSSALGLLFWLGFRFGTILAVTPFLVLAIGVDDAFLQLQSWARLLEELPDQPKSERMRLMLHDIGPSITITSLTNFFAFLVGYFTPTPEIQLFCIGNAVAIILDYLYQISMYCCMISIGARMDEKNREPTKAPAKLATQKHPVVDELKDSHFIVAYSRWIASPFTTIFFLFGLVAYWYVTAKGALQMSVILSSKSLVIDGSELIAIENLREQWVLPNYTTVIVLVNRAGNLSSPDRLQMADNLISTFESFPEAIGPETTHYWMRDYRIFQESANEEFLGEEEFEGNLMVKDPFTREAMKGFLEWPEFRHWTGFIKFNDEDRLDRFMATVSFHGEKLGEFNVRKELLERWRKVVDSFPALNASIFDDFCAFVDQTDSMVPATLSSSLVTLITMLVICFLFMNSLFTIIIATLSIISICLGVFGFLALWNVNLDPISMSCLIMSIGFSVDFPAHIAFHFHREGLEHPDSKPAERIARSLLSIGFPLLQCGLSTVLFVLCLICIKTYMGEVFVKTVFLVVSLGLLHGLVIVPSFLCTLSNLHSLIWKKRKGNEIGKHSIMIRDMCDYNSTSTSSISSSVS